MMILEMMASSIKGMRGSLILIQIGEADFLAPTGRLESLFIAMVGKEGTQILKKIG